MWLLSLLQCYLDPLSGCKFYSKPQVFQYLKTLKLGSRTPIKRKPDIGLPLVSKVRSHKFSCAFFLYSFLFCNFVYWILLLSLSLSTIQHVSVTMFCQIWEFFFVPYKVGSSLMINNRVILNIFLTHRETSDSIFPMANWSCCMREIAMVISRGVGGLIIKKVSFGLLAPTN